MELSQLKYFKCVAETGKLSAAAEALFLSAPALSASISRLENELGTKLFERTNNHLELNKQGEIFLKYVNQVFTTLEYARQEIDQSIMLQQNHISIATTTSNMWSDLFTTFSLEYSDFTISTTNMSRFQLEQSGLHPQHSFLFAEEKDIPPSYLSELNSIQLFEDCLVAMVHPSHPLADKETLDLRLLENETLFYPTPGLNMYERISRIFEENDMPMPYGSTFPYLIYRQMALEGRGISFTSKHISTLEPPADLRYIPIANTRTWRFCLYWRKQRSLTKNELLFKDFVTKFYNV